MSGHSKWASIKHKKGALDAKRGKIFTRLIKELTVAARAGGGDPDMNPRLRTIIADAKAANMPADNIKRAIRRGTGEEPGVSYEEAQYEAYGPGGAAVIIDVLTDNKNRTVGELRHLLEKHGGNLAATNAVAWMFTKKGYIVVEKAKADEEKLIGAVLDAGADDLQDDDDNWEVLSAPEAFQAVRDAVKQLGIEPASAAGLDDSAELRQARRQGRAADAEADGSARRPRRRAARLVELRHRGEGDRGLARVRDLRHRPRLRAHRLRLRRDRRVAPPHRGLRRHQRAGARLVSRQAPAHPQPARGAARASAGPTASRSKTCFTPSTPAAR